MARAEALAVGDGVRFVNQHLVELFEHRSLESIKGVRRKAEYRQMVQEALAEKRLEPEQGSVARPPQAPAASVGKRTQVTSPDTMEEVDPSQENNQAFMDANLALLAELEDQNVKDLNLLRKIALGAARDGDIDDDIERWLITVLPDAKAIVPVRRHNTVVLGQQAISGRKRRKRAYAAAQELARKDFTALAREVLKGNVTMRKEEGGVPQEQLAQHWKQIFEMPDRKSVV